MHVDQALDVVEPAELFLRKIVCDVKLAMYQRAINLLKTIEYFSAVEDTNSILNNATFESPSEIVDEIHKTLEERVRNGLAQYDVITVGGNLPFLCDLLEVITAVDCFDDHETIVNLCSIGGEPAETLYHVLCLLKDFDEEQYYNVITAVSISLIDKIRDLHATGMAMAEDQQLTVTNHNFDLLRKVVKENRTLIISKLFSESKVTNQLPARQITMLARPYFDDYRYSHPKEFAKELIGLYLLTGALETELFDTIQSQITYLCSDDSFIANTIPYLGTLYTELSH